MNRWLRMAPGLVALFLVAGPTEAVGQGGGMQLNYANADVRDVIRSLSTVLGINVLIAEDVPARRVTYSTPAPVPIDELGTVLEVILESQQLVLVRQGPVAQVVPADKAPATGPVSRGKTLPTPPPVGLVTQLVPLEHISADEAIAVLRQLAGPLARIEALPRANGLLITDHASNVRRYLELLRGVDVPSEGEAGLRTYVYRLKHASAAELAVTLAQVYGVQVAQAPTRPRVASLSDRSLSAALEGFQRRELDQLAQRRANPLLLPAAPPATATADSAGAPPGLVGRTTIVPELATNALVIRTEPPNFPVLRATIADLDVRPALVLLEVFITEIGLTQATEFGVNWAILANRNGVDYDAALRTPGFSDSSLALLEGLTFRAVSLNNTDIRALVRALAQDGTARVLSTPHVLALNNEPARILVGSQVPFSQSTRTGLDVVVDRTVQYRNVGTQLTVVPTINDDGYVTLRVLQEASALTTQTLAAALDAPVISTREAETSALVRHGETIVIGGLIDETEQEIESGVPFLKDIPLLGYLFKSRSTQRVRTELAIFLTPHVIATDADAAELLDRERTRIGLPLPAPPDSVPPRE